MVIERCEYHTREELFEKLRDVTLRGTANSPNPVYIYQDATLALEVISPSTLVPAQFYLLHKTLDRVRALQSALLEQHTDIFHLDGYMRYWVEGNPLPFTLLPPVIEYQEESDGTVNPLIVDGLHRIAWARTLEYKKELQNGIQVVTVRGVTESLPYYGRPNPRAWQDVRKYARVPQNDKKRLWRIPVQDAYKLYRDFDSAFGGVGQPRTATR